MRIRSGFFVMLMIGILALLLSGCVPPDPEINTDRPRNLDQYYNNLDYSCQVDTDCAIKDVRSCCGYQPRCVNRQSQPPISYVLSICGSEGTVDESECKVPRIRGCQCVSERCVAGN